MVLNPHDLIKRVLLVHCIALSKHSILLEAQIRDPGSDFNKPSPKVVAYYTFRILHVIVPAAVAVMLFLQAVRVRGRLL